MQAWLKITAMVLLVGPVAVIRDGSATAQAMDDSAAAFPEMLCDYCKDFTDSASNAGPVRSSYRPGEGYATESPGEGVFFQAPEEQASGVKFVQRQLGTGSR